MTFYAVKILSEEQDRFLTVCRGAMALTDAPSLFTEYTLASDALRDWIELSRGSANLECPTQMQIVEVTLGKPVFNTKESTT